MPRNCKIEEAQKGPLAHTFEQHYLPSIGGNEVYASEGTIDVGQHDYLLDF